MDVVRASLVSLLSFFLSFGCMAASDPVSWTLSPSSGFPSVEIGGSATVVYTLTNHSPGPTLIKTSFLKKGLFAIKDNCNNQSIAREGSCAIFIRFSPHQAGQSTVQLTYQYHNNRIPLPTLTATAVTHQSNAQATGIFHSVPASFNLRNPVQHPTFILTFTNVSKTRVTGYAGNEDGTNILSATPAIARVFVLPGNTCGTSSSPVTLEPGENCQLQGKIIPLALGKVTLNALFTYAGGLKTVIPTISTDIVNGTGSCIASAEVKLPLPATTNFYADNVVQFVFENECANESTTLGAVTVNSTFSPAGGQSQINRGEDNCSNTTLAAGQNCTVLASVTASGTNSSTMQVEASASSGGSTASALTSAQVVSAAYQHKVTFINQCPFNVWYGVANDNATDKVDPTNPAGPDDYLLAAQQPGVVSASKTLTFSGDYFGIFFPRTGCQTIGGQLFCTTGECTPSAPPNGGKCLEGNEPFPPYTKIEMNFFNVAQNDGSFDGDYDISLIEGYNIPVDMKGFGPGETITPFPPVNNSSFQCGNAGALIQAANPPTPELPLAACPWNVTPPTDNTMEPRFFNFVTDGDTAAGQNNCSCTPENPICGIAYKAADPQKGNLIMSCGQYLGTWALKTLCTQPFATSVPLTSNNDSRIRFNCDQDISTVSGTQSGYTPGTTLSDLYGCVFNGSFPTKLNSCYVDATDSTSYCCGAVDWNTTSPYVTAQDKQSITQNPDWGGPTVGGISAIVPSPYETIVWYKAACPTAYSYPFDDHSTSFFCKKSPAATNVKMDYQVVFCPGGVIG